MITGLTPMRQEYWYYLGTMKTWLKPMRQEHWYYLGLLELGFKPLVVLRENERDRQMLKILLNHMLWFKVTY